MGKNKLRLGATFPFYLYGFAFGVGTNFARGWYYPIKGIGVLDILLVLHFFCALLFSDGALRKLPPKTVDFICLMLALLLWLLLSFWVNSFAYEVESTNLLAILRLLYFVVIVIFISKHVEKFGYVQLLIGYVIGVVTIFYQDFSSIGAENAVFFGIPVLSNPNVIGVALGLAVYFCSLGVIAGKTKLFLPLALALAALTITTFSKAAWILAGLGLFANLLALRMPDRLVVAKNKRNSLITYLVIFLVTLSVVYYAYGEVVMSLLRLKMESTADIGSIEIRANLLLAGAYAALDHPLFGLGFGNYYKVENLYRDILLPPLGREDNAHNLFAQVAATGGIPALVILLAVIALTLLRLSKVLQNRTDAPASIRWLYLVISFIVFTLFGSVQLQLLAQPTFWFFSALIIGLCNTSDHIKKSFQKSTPARLASR